MPEMKIEEEDIPKVVGRILSDRNFRKDFGRDAGVALADYGYRVDERAMVKLVELNDNVKARLFKRVPRRGEAALHCEVESTIGYA